AVRPDDPEVHLWLGESYFRLLHSTRERVWGKQMPELVQLRRTQTSVALNRAIVLKPDLARAHHALGVLYEEMGYLDLELEHIRTYLKLLHEAGPGPGVSAEDFAAQEAALQGQLARLAGLVDERTKAYTVAASGQPVLGRAMLALQNGLAGKAREMLLESDVSAFGPEGTALELELLLRTGGGEGGWGWGAGAHGGAGGGPPGPRAAG